MELKTQAWIEKDGKVKTLDGKWCTPKQLLLRAKRAILNTPEAYDQACVVEPSATNPCGVQACICGWILIDTRGTEEEVADDFEKVCKVISGTEEWPWLFQGAWVSQDPYIKNLQHEYREAESEIDRKGMAIAAGKAIDY